MSSEMTLYTGIFVCFVLVGVLLKVIFWFWHTYAKKARTLSEKQLRFLADMMKKITASLKVLGFVGALATLGGASPSRAVLLGLALVAFMLVTTWDR